MAPTYYEDFFRDDGSQVLVEFGFRAGSPATYSPNGGADGGDGCEVTIIKALTDEGEVELTTAEAERFEARIAETFFADDDDYDPAEWRS